jgi:hypothetical protein
MVGLTSCPTDFSEEWLRMVLMSDQKKLEMKEPCIYQIQIQGTLDESWGDYFGGGFVTIKDDDNLITTLHTLPIDQPEFVGLVNRLNGLGLRLLSVKSVPAVTDHSTFEHDSRPG